MLNCEGDLHIFPFDSPMCTFAIESGEQICIFVFYANFDTRNVQLNFKFEDFIAGVVFLPFYSPNVTSFIARMLEMSVWRKMHFILYILQL